MTCVDITIANEAGELERVASEVDAFASRHALSSAVRRRISVVLDELLNNIMSYAYLDTGPHSIEVRLSLEGNQLTLTVTDDGIAFNPFDRQSPDTSVQLEDRRVGGLGIYIVRELMDDVFWERRADQNVVVLHSRTDVHESDHDAILGLKESQ